MVQKIYHNHNKSYRECCMTRSEVRRSTNRRMAKRSKRHSY